MKSTLLLLTAILLIPVLLLSVAQPPQARAVEQEKKDEKRVLRHVVLFQFKESASDEKVQEMVDTFGQLPSKIDSIVDYEHGVNNSPEGLNEGLTHAFVVTFDSEEGRAEYLPHPAHQEFVKLLKPHLKKAVVVDYWAE